MSTMCAGRCRAKASAIVEEFRDTIASVSDTSASLQLRDLERAMAKLPVERRETILLVALEGMSYQAMAKCLSANILILWSRL
jgi:RNA polymerase sigma-70 factor, ECF subfamily